MKAAVRIGKLAGIGTGTLLLASCAGPISVKDMAQDPAAYSVRYFSFDENTSLDVRKFVPAPGKEPLGFKVLTLTGTVENPNAKQPVVPVTFDIVETNDNDNGLVRIVETIKSNDVPSYITYSLSYRAMFNIRYQGSTFANRIAPRILSYRDISSWPKRLSAIKENTRYVYRYSTGFAGQLANFPQGATECKSSTFYPGSQFHPAVPGRAIDVDCNLINSNGVATGHIKETFLTQYGIFVPREKKGTTYTSIFHIEKIEAR
jgi:hypothetical protein